VEIPPLEDQTLQPFLISPLTLHNRSIPAAHQLGILPSPVGYLGPENRTHTVHNTLSGSNPNAPASSSSYIRPPKVELSWLASSSPPAPLSGSGRTRLLSGVFPRPSILVAVLLPGSTTCLLGVPCKSESSAFANPLC
jgi:hypothetical protein